ncbi:MAG: NAD-dependent dehydratase, partial [Pseudomonas alloputida]
AESLNFIQTQRFDMGNSRQLERKYALTHPDMTQALENTVRYVSDYLMKKSKREGAGQRG